MKVLNPDYVEPETTEQSAMTAKEAQIRQWFANNTNKRHVTFDQLRTKYGKTAEQWPDGLIHQKLLGWGFEVEE